MEENDTCGHRMVDSTYCLDIRSQVVRYIWLYTKSNNAFYKCFKSKEVNRDSTVTAVTFKKVEAVV